MNFNIADLYQEEFKNNQITCRVKYNGKTFLKDTNLADGTRVYNYYRGFLAWKINGQQDISIVEGDDEDDTPEWLMLSEEHASMSKLDILLKDCPAQYANENGTPFIIRDFTYEK